MGLIYSLTKKILPGSWRGLHPTTLDELVGRTEILWSYNIDILNFQIVPSIVEPLHDKGMGLVQRTPYYLDFLATYSNGKRLHVYPPFPPQKGNGDDRTDVLQYAKFCKEEKLVEGNGNDYITEDCLLKYAQFLQRRLTEGCKYKNVQVYQPIYKISEPSADTYEPASSSH